jgi:hypothetical protein
LCCVWAQDHQLALQSACIIKRIVFCIKLFLSEYLQGSSSNESITSTFKKFHPLVVKS